MIKSPCLKRQFCRLSSQGGKMSSQASTNNGIEDLLVNHDVAAITFNDGFVRVSKITSVNQTMGTVRFIPFAGRAQSRLLTDIEEVHIA